jgi:non-homologous end joining protein Ku
MAPRANWKGYLKLSLVSCPIALYPAIAASEKISFRQVNKQTGNRLRQQLVDVVTGEPVEREDKGRGYEVGENQFLLVEDTELETARQVARTLPFSAAPTQSADRPEPRPVVKRSEPHGPPALPADAAPPTQPAPPAVRIENNRTIEIERFVPRAQIDPRYYLTPYYVTPRDAVGQEAYVVIRDAMRVEGMVGMGRVVLSNRERPIVVEPTGNGLRGITLRYAHEVRSEADYFDEIPKLELPEDLLDLAKHILKTKTGDFDPAWLEDRYRTALVDMLRDKKRAVLPKKEGPVAPSTQNVLSLMDALRRSLASAASVPKPTPRKAAAAKRPTPAKRSPARRRAG